MKRSGFLWIVFFVLQHSIRGGLDVDPRVVQGQDALYQLDYDGAKKTFRELALESPDDPTGQAFLAIVLWNEILFAAGNLAVDDYATPMPFTKQKTYKPIGEETKRFREANDKLIAVCDRLLEENPGNVAALYFKGVAYENLAAEAVAITKSSGAAFSHGRKAKGLHERVLKLDPSFVDAKTSIAVYEFAKATLPWSIKWIAFLLGFRGDKDEAMAKLQEVSEKGVYRRLDALVVMALLHAWKGDPHETVRIYRGLAEKYPRNYLLDINTAAVYETVLKDPRDALNIYQRLAETLDQKAPGLKPGEVYYRIGRTQYDLRDYSLALEAFQKAVALPKSEPETEVLSSLYMARIHEQQGNRDEARELYQKVAEYQGPRDVLDDSIEEARRRLKDLN